MLLIKILHYGITNNLGGIETYLYNLVKNIDKNKYQMDFLVVGKEKPCFYDELKNMGCNFYYITPRTQNPRTGRKEIRTLILNNHYDILHCHCNTLSYIDPILEAKTLPIKIIVHSRNGGAKVRFHSLVFNFINQYRLPYNDIVLLAVSKQAGRWMFKSHNFFVINNGVDTSKFIFDEKIRNEIRTKYNLIDNKVLILVGALRKQKNHKFAFNVLKELLKMDNSYRLILLGEGKLKKELMEYSKKLNIDKYLLFLGNKENVTDYLSASDIFIFPSFYEGFPNALLEAEASGLKCYASETITKEVAVENFIEYISLNKGAKYWARLINSNNEDIKRLNAKLLIENRKKDKKSEINILTSIYEELVNEKD